MLLRGKVRSTVNDVHQVIAKNRPTSSDQARSVHPIRRPRPSRTGQSTTRSQWQAFLCHRLQRSCTTLREDVQRVTIQESGSGIGRITSGSSGLRYRALTVGAD